ncbi:hypothetical protein L210DRAFT_979194 [Boletus edulis BED1]|uniref:Inhibitor I9 domain-containing protein n=1 Tax=Boletus edulis BED1 TaxID=1328754 RepID=A0AAD4BW30_BOLED|nr:hypothetical protein L210DRAFT_979194 [Boletus edulis BED1]
MSEQPQTFILMFENASAYDKYKQEVIASGGKIKDDLGALLGFTAVMPPTLVQSIRAGSLVDNGITSFEPDSVVTIQ